MPLLEVSPPSEQAGPTLASSRGSRSTITVLPFLSTSSPPSPSRRPGSSLYNLGTSAPSPQSRSPSSRPDLGLNPSSDGELIRIPIPALTDERRRDLAKLVSRRVEEGRVSVRNARRESVDQARSLKKAKEISEDEERRTTEQLQKLTDSFVKRITDLGQAKEQELMEG